MILVMTKTTGATKKKASKRKEYSAPALEKGLDILELLSTESEGLNLSQIATKLDRTVGEVFRMLMVLEQRKYVALTPATDQYVMTLKMFKLSHQFAPVKRLTIAAALVMEKLSIKVEQSCHLVIYYNGEGLIVAQQDSPGSRCYGVKLGSSVPLLDSCSGNLFLAYAPENTRKEMLAQQSPKARKSINPTELQSMVDRVISDGGDSRPSHQVQGVQDIGFPVFDYGGAMIASLAIPFLEHIDGSHRVDFEATKKHLKKAALEISDILGYEA
jgi:DNA-binding IclR family transcriptional regulator